MSTTTVTLTISRHPWRRWRISTEVTRKPMAEGMPAGKPEATNAQLTDAHNGLALRVGQLAHMLERISAQVESVARKVNQ